MGTTKKGFAAYGSYATDGLNLTRLLALIPDPDTSPSQGGAPWLDEMSPGAAAQLQTEIAAMSATGIAARSAIYTVTAGDVTATQSDIATGLLTAPLVPSAVVGTSIVEIWRAGVNVTRDAAITSPSVGTLRVKSGASTYVLTAGDIVKYLVR